jgi:hypothetical protein
MLTLSCLDLNPENRPSIEQLLQSLKELIRELKAPEGTSSFNLQDFEKMHDDSIKTLSA